MNDGCTIKRLMWMQKSVRTDDGRVIPTAEPEIEVEVCGTYLHTSIERQTGICDSCHEGRECKLHIGYNVFADELEKQRAASRSL